MIINKHFFAGSHCVFCGAETWPRVQKRFSDRGETVPQTDTRSCIPRDDHISQRELRPEPARREIACEDADTIAERRKAIEAERTAALNAAPEEPKPPIQEAYDPFVGYY